VEREARSHEDLRMSGHAQVQIAVPVDVVYSAVADLPRMGEWSPENLGGEWITSIGAAVGCEVPRAQPERSRRVRDDRDRDRGRALAQLRVPGREPRSGRHDMAVRLRGSVRWNVGQRELRVALDATPEGRLPRSSRRDCHSTKPEQRSPSVGVISTTRWTQPSPRSSVRSNHADCGDKSHQTRKTCR